ncbi:MAG: hypothetical protein LBG57_00015 [Treponema sp.]|nr:hypothetical protein [Treponema sp.]
MDGAQGTYRVGGDDIVFSIRRERNRLTESSTRGLPSKRGHQFSFERPPDIQAAVNAVRTGIHGKGGVFNGNENAGNFQASGIVGEYLIGSQVDVTIYEKPVVIPHSLIEREVKKFFGIRP